MSAGKLSDWIALRLLPGLGPIFLKRLLGRFADPGAVAWRVSPRELESVARAAPGSLAAVAEARRDLRARVDDERRRADALGLVLVSMEDENYPEALAAIHDPPILLYVRGRLERCAVRVSIVGSRQASTYGLRIAAGLASGLAARGVEVVSGGARGIDTAAHVGALEDRGRTVVVLGSGFLHPYPRENVGLFARAVESGGAVISEFPLDISPRAENFPRRNRVISGLSLALVVVEAGLRSGSLGSAALAADQGRQVLAVPGPVHSELSWGCHRLIQDGAKLVQNVEDVMEELPPALRDELEPARPPEAEVADPLDGSTDDERATAALLDVVEPRSIDSLAEAVSFSLARLQTALLTLELRGLIERHRGASYTRRSNRRLI